MSLGVFELGCVLAPTPPSVPKLSSRNSFLQNHNALVMTFEASVLIVCPEGGAVNYNFFSDLKIKI